MIILSGNNLSVAFGEDVLFSDVSFEVQSGEKVGFVGINGTGKTTLFKAIIGEISPESGNISKTADTTVGYMEQHVIRSEGISVYEETLSIFEKLINAERELDKIHAEIDAGNNSAEILEKQMHLQEGFERDGGLTFRARAKSTLLGLGFSAEDIEKPVEVLSGGEKSKVQLGKLLLSNATLLLLDEPTNHLDIAAVEWLEKFLLEYKGAYVVISHDRYFLDKVTGKTLEMENGHLTTYKGNYTKYLQLKEEARLAAERVYERTKKEISRIEGIIEQQKRFNQEHNYVTIASKQKSIDRLEKTLEKPEDAPEALRFSFQPKDGCGNDVLLADKLALAMDGRILFKNVTLDIKRGERVFILGSNGSGKTSLFRILTGRYEANAGTVRFGSRVDMGYYDQLMEGLSGDKTVMDEVWDAFPKMTPTEVRCALGSFLFRGDDVFKKISLLSGGEKARVALLKLMLGGQNFLLLDEPTNHLDITSREALENALLGYDGTMLIISHDRYLINKLASRIYYLDEGGTTEYKGNYDAFLAARELEAPEQKSDAEKPAPKVNAYKQKKEFESEKRKAANREKRAEQAIAELEAEIEKKNAELSTPEIAADYEKTLSLSTELEELNQKLEAAMEEWDAAVEAMKVFEE